MESLRVLSWQKLQLFLPNPCCRRRSFAQRSGLRSSSFERANLPRSVQSSPCCSRVCRPSRINLRHDPFSQGNRVRNRGFARRCGPPIALSKVSRCKDARCDQQHALASFVHYERIPSSLIVRQQGWVKCGVRTMMIRFGSDWGTYVQEALFCFICDSGDVGFHG